MAASRSKSARKLSYGPLEVEHLCHCRTRGSTEVWRLVYNILHLSIYETIFPPASTREDGMPYVGCSAIDF